MGSIGSEIVDGVCGAGGDSKGGDWRKRSFMLFGARSMGLLLLGRELGLRLGLRVATESWEDEAMLVLCFNLAELCCSPPTESTLRLEDVD